MGMSMEPPAIIDERYEVLGLIGQGGLGQVFRVKDRLSGEISALKILHNESQGDDLASEFKTLVEIHHPNIVEVLDYGVSQNRPYFTTIWLSNRP